ARADFAISVGVQRLPPLTAFRRGTDEYPDESVTLFIDVEAFVGGPLCLASGPGIQSRSMIAPKSLPSTFLADWHDINRDYPLGIDLWLGCGAEVMALPRTTRLTYNLEDAPCTSP